MKSFLIVLYFFTPFPGHWEIITIEDIPTNEDCKYYSSILDQQERTRSFCVENIELYS